MNGKKLINHGSTLASDGPQTVATKDYVDNFKTFATGITITGANYPNGMIQFAATTGITGISLWPNAALTGSVGWPSLPIPARPPIGWCSTTRATAPAPTRSSSMSVA